MNLLKFAKFTPFRASNKDVLDHLKHGYGFYETACLLNTDINLLAVKFMVMNSAGHQLNIPVDLKSNFLSHQVL